MLLDLFIHDFFLLTLYGASERPTERMPLPGEDAPTRGGCPYPGRMSLPGEDVTTWGGCHYLGRMSLLYLEEVITIGEAVTAWGGYY
jgi:hypothetical protein